MYIRTPIKVGRVTCSLYASSGPKVEGVQNNNQRGRGSGKWRNGLLILINIYVRGTTNRRHIISI